MKRVLSMTACLLLMFTAAWADPTGNWTDDGNYANSYKSYSESGHSVTIQIKTAAQLARFAKEYTSFGVANYTVYIDADLDLSAHYWVPIAIKGVYENYNVTINGKGHQISGMTIHGQPTYAGLLGECRNVTVQNLTVSNAQIDAGSARYAGFIAAYAEDCIIQNCTVENSSLTLATTSWTLCSFGGGLVGLVKISSNQTFSHNKVLNTQLTDNSRYGAIGGLFGATQVTVADRTLSVTDCHTSVQMVSNENEPDNYSYMGMPAGGLIGMAGEGRTDLGVLKIKHCSTGGTLTMRGGARCSGLVGINQEGGNLVIEYCVSAMNLDGGTTRDCGGLVAYAWAGSTTDINNSYCCSYIYNGVNSYYSYYGGLVGNAGDEKCNLTNCTFAGTIFGKMARSGAIFGFVTESTLSTMRENHRINEVVYDRSLCNLPVTGFPSVTFDADEVTGKTSKEMASDDEPYKSLLKAPIDIKTAYNGTLCYEDNIMLAAIPFYVKDAQNSYYYAWQMTTEAVVKPLAYNRATKTALAMYDVVKSPNGAAVNTFLTIDEDTESAEKTVTPFDPGEADVVVTYYNSETAKRTQRKVHLVVTYGVPWNDSEPTDLPGGNGAKNDPYLIQNASQLAAVASNKEVYNRSDMYYRLANDIFLNTNLIQTDETVKDGATAWTPLEWHANLDGNGKTIYGLYVTHQEYVEARIEKSYTTTTHVGNTEEITTHTYYVNRKVAGLFGLLSGYVHDLAIVDSYLSVSEANKDYLIYSGLLCGIMTGEAKAERCMAHGIVDGRNCSGLVGNALDIDLQASINANRGLSNPVTVSCGTVEDCYACVHVEYGLAYYLKNGTKRDSYNGTGYGVVGNNVKQVNRCVSTGKVENFTSRNGITSYVSDVSDVSTWYFDKQQMTTEKQGSDDRGEHTTAEMTQGGIFAGNDVWLHEKGRYPILRQFAKTPYGDILSMPVLFADGDRAGSVTKVFEFPADNVTWAATKGDTYVDVINECGAATPMSTGIDHIYARTNTSLSQSTKALRVMQVDVKVPEGTTVGIDFTDANCKAAWLSAFNKGSDEVVTLRNAVTVTDEQATAFNTQAQTLGVTAFPEMRFFTGIKILKPGYLSNLSQLTEVELPRQLTDIGPGAFSGCSSLEEVTIPSTTTTVEPGVLDGSSIKNLYVDSRNTSFKVQDNALITTDEELRLMAYPPARGESSITLHGPFHNIAYHAFYKIPALDAIYIDYPKPDGSAVQLEDDESIVHYNDADGQLMDIYVNDGSFEGTQWESAQYATGGNLDGVLMQEYMEKNYWQSYASAGKLHRYFPLTVTAAKWASMYIGFCTKLPDNIKAYILPDSPESGTILLKRTNNRLHHTVPVVIYCETPDTYILTPEPGMSADDDVPMSGNKLQGTDIGQGGKYGLQVNQSEIQNEYSILVLSLSSKTGEVGFYGFPGTWIPPYKTYLTYNQVGNSASFGVTIDDTIDDSGTTSLREKGIVNSEKSAAAEWYDLSGRRIESSQFSVLNSRLKKGLYIHNGRKVVVR